MVDWVDYLKEEFEIVKKTQVTLKKHESRFRSHPTAILDGKYHALLTILKIASDNKTDEESFDLVCKRICETTYDQSMAMYEYSQYILKMPRRYSN